jgi:type IV pilus assembly protein PilM
MIRLLTSRNYSPIGVDIGSRAVKLLQFNSDRTRVLDAARRELPPLDVDPAVRASALAEAITSAREQHNFRGRDAVVCLGGRELYVQNIRIPKMPGEETEKVLLQEASSRLPYSTAEAEVRFVEAGDVRQGDAVKREVILLACRRDVLEQMLQTVGSTGLKPIAVDVEPLALLRCYGWQYRRDEDRQQRAMFVHVGATSTVVIIAHGSEPLFIKYIDVGGQHMDEAVASYLNMELHAAASLRRHNGDRRADQQDQEIARGLMEGVHPVLEKLASELALCVRYHSVTFRGQPLVRVVIGGGEASQLLVEYLAARLDLKCELGDPLRNFEMAIQTGRRGQWDIAVGMALRLSEKPTPHKARESVRT